MKVKIRIYSFILGLLFVNQAFSQDTILEIDKDNFQVNDSVIAMKMPELFIIPLPEERPSHPYLFFQQKDIPGLKQRVTHPEFREIWLEIVKDAKYPSNNKLNLIDQILPACLVFHINSDTNAALQAIAIIDTLISKGHSWVKPYTQTPDLKYMNWDSGDKALAIAYVYDMLHDLLSIEKKKLYLSILNEKLFRYYIQAHAVYDTVNERFFDQTGHFDWWTSVYFSWNSRINSAFGIAALATLWEMPESGMVLKYAKTSLGLTLPEFNQGESESGGYDEGNMIMGKHLADLIRFYAAYQNLYNKDDGFFDLPGVRKSMEFYMDFVGPDDKFVPFGFNVHRNVIDPPSELYLLGDLYNNREFVSFIDLNSHPSHLKPYALFWRPVINDTIIRIHTKTKTIYKDIEWGILHDKRMFIPFKAGDNAANHSQLDAGNVLLYLNETYLLHSPGSDNIGTEMHNCLVINNKDQIVGDIRDRDYGGHSETFGKIMFCETEDKNHFCGMDLTSCYEDTKLYHRYLFLNEMGTFIVIDKVETNDPAGFKLNWHTTNKLSEYSDTTFSIDGGNRGVNVQIASDIICSTEITQSGNSSTLTIQSGKNSHSAVFITMFSPFALKSPGFSAEFSLNMLTLNVTVRNKTKPYYFIFEEDKFNYIRDFR